jgi:uncharacterized protein
MPRQLEPTDRTRLRRRKDRGSFDVATVHAILDEALACHVGFAIDGRPWVVPTIHARIDDDLFLHGAAANHMLRTMSNGVDACVTATLIDGLVLARSAFHHSMNYRSVMVFGRATRVDRADDKRRALAALVEHVARGRGDDARAPSDEELRTTLVLRLPIAEASAKLRTGGPLDDDADMALGVWAGIVPCTITFGAPIADAGVDAPTPDYLRTYAR